MLLAIGLLLAGCAASAKQPPAAHTSPAGTVVKTFAAYDRAGNLAVNVHDIERGSCWTSSIAAPMPDAYRCIAGNAIFDPCFAPAKGAAANQVACIAAPWDQAEVLQLTKPLPAGTPPGGTRAWAFQLATGVRCVSSTGTVPEVADVNLDYHCTDATDAALVDPTAHQVIAQDADPDAKTLQRVAVTTIWRG